MRSEFILWSQLTVEAVCPSCHSIDTPHSARGAVYGVSACHLTFSPIDTLLQAQIVAVVLEPNEFASKIFFFINALAFIFVHIEPLLNLLVGIDATANEVESFPSL